MVGAQESPVGKGMPDGKRPTPTEMAEKRMDCMAKELNLTPEQRTRIEQMHRERVRHMAEQKAAHEAQMKQILTPEQYARWEQMQQEMKPGHHRHGDRPHWKGQGPKGDSMKCPKPACKRSCDDRDECCKTMKKKK